jgi:hypothetical protein
LQLYPNVTLDAPLDREVHAGRIAGMIELLPFLGLGASAPPTLLQPVWAMGDTCVLASAAGLPRLVFFGAVDGADLGALLGAWGSLPE